MPEYTHLSAFSIPIAEQGTEVHGSCRHGVRKALCRPVTKVKKKIKNRKRRTKNVKK